MEKEKKKGKGKRYRTKSLIKQSFVEAVVSVTSKFETMAGIERLMLSPMTQKFVNCRIGEDVTAERPWVYVDKEKIDDSIFLHENSSEFLPIKNYVETYPEDSFLIGSYCYQQENESLFYFCTNLQAKDEVLEHLKADKQAIVDKLLNALTPTPKEWVSNGSEEEIDVCMPVKFRPLFEIILESKYPIYFSKIKFKVRNVEEAIDGYMELLPGRFSCNNIFRKRLENSTQSMPEKIDVQLQTLSNAPMNKVTQYSYKYKEVKMSDAALKKMLTFLSDKYEQFCEILKVNFHINLYKDDYTDMPNKFARKPIYDPVDALLFQDVIWCKHKKVSCISWSCLISGIIAIGYTRTPNFFIRHSEPIYNAPNETIHDHHLVLVWCYTDVVHPKLYLHSQQDVTSISFCPYDADIIVGGLSSGQVIVWDITSKLQQVETREIITQKEQENRIILQPYMKWMKNPPDVKHVYPCVISNIEKCHNSAVTDIKWIPCDHYITKYGKYAKCSEGKTHMQFFTSSTDDGTILIWDLKVDDEDSEVIKVRKRLQRLSKLPPALNIDVSPLKEMHRDFIPRYKLTLTNPANRLKIPISGLILNNQNFEFNIINPHTFDDYKERTYYEAAISENPFHYEQKLVITSVLGNIFTSRWEGSDFDTGHKFNTEKTIITPFLTVHDGPLQLCKENPFNSHLLLTVGGKVFALWDITKGQNPIFWRKSNLRYVSGMWALTHPLSVVIVRQDLHFELWNLIEGTKHAVRVFRYNGNPLTDLFHEAGKKHVTKKTFITTDIAGAVRVYLVPTSLFTETDSQFEDSERFQQKANDVKAQTNKLKEKIKAKLIIPGMEIPSIEESPEVKLVAEIEETLKENVDGKIEEADVEVEEVSTLKKGVIKISNAEKFRIKQEKIMYDILIEKNRLNLTEIEEHKIPLQIYLEQQRAKQRKIDEILANKEKLFEQVKSQMETTSEIPMRKRMSVYLPREVYEEMKSTFLEQYKNLEENVLCLINKNKHRYVFDWTTMIATSKERSKNSKERKLSRIKFSMPHLLTEESSEYCDQLLTGIS